MDHGWGVCWNENSEPCNKLQPRAIIYYLSVYPNTPHFALEGCMGWILNKTTYQYDTSVEWHRLIDMDDNRLSKILLKWDYDICKNWFFEAKNILFCLISDYIWWNEWMYIVFEYNII